MTSYCNCTTCQTKHKQCLDLISSYLVGTSTSSLCKGVPTSCPSLTSFSNDINNENDKSNNNSTKDAVENTCQQTKTKKKNKKIHTRRSYLVRTDGSEQVENRPIVIPIFKDDGNNERTVIYDPSNIGSGVVLSHAARHVFDELLAEHVFMIILESTTGIEATINIQERLSSYTLWYCANQAVCSLFKFLASRANIYTYSNEISRASLRMLLSSSLLEASFSTFPSSITDHELTNCMVPVYPYDSYGIQPNIHRRKTSKILYSRINIPKSIEQYVNYISYFASFDYNESSTVVIRQDMQLGMIPCWSGVFFCPPKYNKRRTRKTRIFGNKSISSFMNRILACSSARNNTVRDEREKENFDSKSNMMLPH